MSQAENSNTPFNQFEPSHAQATQLGQPFNAEPTQPAAWETLNFPNALDVDAIPQEGLNEASDRDVPQFSEMAASAEPSAPELVQVVDHRVLAPLLAEASPVILESAIASNPANEPKPLNAVEASPVISESAIVSDLATMTEGNAMTEDAFSALVQENQTLRCQLVELEGALERSQTVLRAEANRWQAKTLTQSVQESQRFNRQAAELMQHSQALATAQENLNCQSQELQSLREQEASQTQELAIAQERLGQMFQELEHAHKATQRQQILIETLTAQLETSQERVAQLERECALTQQRYTEQVQLMLQAESAGRDLRSRLNRQQRYTLQFKAALEKCLEVPAAQGFAHSALSQHPEGETAQSEVTLAIAPSAVFIPKAQPVQPWSAHPGFLVALQSPLADDISEAEIDPVTAAQDVPEEADQQRVASLTDRIAPRITTGRILDAIELPRLADKNEISADAKDSLTNHEFADSMSSEATLAPLEDLAEIDLWAAEDDSDQKPLAQAGEVIQLAFSRLIEVEINSDEPVHESAKADSHQADSREMSSPVEHVSADEAAVAEVTEMAEASQPWFTKADTALVTSASGGKSIETAQRLSPFITLADRQALATQLEEESAVAMPTTASPFYTPGPSPVVYPLRPTKKLSSLAAVKLPSFPKAAK